MSQVDIDLEVSLQHFVAISEQIITLDLEMENDITMLEQLQLAQEELKHRIEELMSLTDKKNVNNQRLIRMAYDTEMQVNMKLRAFKDFITSQMNKVQEGNRMKTAYHQAYSQAEGYFVDNRK
ncbi:hypothetical protein [Cohnella sp. WQ 127256]|uniref:hypothetical protein n=1 Tax=Cohnella sp. WQ 127256 TaxID=2938790 RepID=UPI002117A852|nr:hypothetical protein [Cohnella sp. WQ 127256]